MNVRIFDRFPVLRTSRLVLRAFTPGDAAALRDLRADPENARFQGHDALTGAGAAEAQIARWGKRFALKAEIRWAIASLDDDAFLGTCSYVHFVPAHARGQLVCEVARPASGRGLGTEAIGAMVAFGHGEAGLARIEALVMPGNEASARMLRKAGFEEEGLLRAYGLWKGALHDLRMFSHVRDPGVPS